MQRETGEDEVTSPRGRHLPKIAQAFLRLTVLLAIAALWAGAASPLLARELRIRDFHAELDVLPDSSLDVTETIRVQFIGAWNGLYRTIPAEYSGPSGFNYSLFLTDINATDDDERGARFPCTIAFATACDFLRIMTSSTGM